MILPPSLPPRHDSRMSTPGNTVILGAGIVGLSTAYFLSRSGNTKPESIHVVDPSPELFRCASGLAGGFLASDCEHRADPIDLCTR